MPTKDEQIDTIMKDLIEEPWGTYKRVIRGALLHAYNRGYEAGAMKAQEQMMEAGDGTADDIRHNAENVQDMRQLARGL